MQYLIYTKTSKHRRLPYQGYGGCQCFLLGGRWKRVASQLIYRVATKNFPANRLLSYIFDAKYEEAICGR